MGRRAKGLPGDIQPRAREKLKIIHAAMVIDDLRNPPGNMKIGSGFHNLIFL